MVAAMPMLPGKSWAEGFNQVEGRLWWSGIRSAPTAQRGAVGVLNCRE